MSAAAWRARKSGSRRGGARARNSGRRGGARARNAAGEAARGRPRRRRRRRAAAGEAARRASRAAAGRGDRRAEKRAGEAARGRETAARSRRPAGRGRAAAGRGGRRAEEVRQQAEAARRKEEQRRQAEAARWLRPHRSSRRRSGERSREAFVPRFRVLGELENQLMLANGCPGLILYGRRRTGKSTSPKPCGLSPRQRRRHRHIDARRALTRRRRSSISVGATGRCLDSTLTAKRARTPLQRKKVFSGGG